MSVYKEGTKKLFSCSLGDFIKDYISIIKYMKFPRLYIRFGKWGLVPGGIMWAGNLARVLDIYSHGILWKDKFNTPRFERPPSMSIVFFRKYKLLIFYSFTNSKLDYDEYFEQYIWIYYYYDGDVQKAMNAWSWIDCNTSENTWDNRYLRKKYRSLVRTPKDLKNEEFLY